MKATSYMMRMKKNKDIDVFQHMDTHGGDMSVCWEWQGQIKGEEGNRRPYFTLDSKKQLVYRIVFNLFHPDEPLQENEVVRHTCDNSICCNPTHLLRGSHTENMADMRERERHGLTHHAVRAIRKLLADAIPQKLIAERFGVSRETVSAIKNKRVYKEVNDDDNR